jgi:cold shock CspA family protein
MTCIFRLTRYLSLLSVARFGLAWLGVQEQAHKQDASSGTQLPRYARTWRSRVTGTVKSLDPTGHGIIQTEDGLKAPFLFIDVLNHKVLILGQRVTFSVRRVQDNAFAENIAHETERQAGART